MRIAVQEARIEADPAQQFGDQFPPVSGVADAVNFQRLADDIEHRHARVERTERVLKDELHVPAVFVQRFALQGQHVPPFAALVVDDPTRIRCQGAHDRLAQGCLAAAALADQAQAFAMTDFETHAVDRAHRRRPAALADAVALDQVLDFQQRSGPVGVIRLPRPRRQQVA